MRYGAPALAMLLVVAVLALGGIGPSSAQDGGMGTPDPAAACATPGADGSPEATPILVVRRRRALIRATPPRRSRSFAPPRRWPRRPRNWAS